MSNVFAMEVSDLSGRALDWAVALSEGRHLEPSYFAWVRRTFSSAGWSDHRIEQHLASIGADHPFMRDAVGNAVPVPGYASDWSIAGPLMEREGIFPIPNISKDKQHPGWDYVAKKSHYNDMEPPCYGETPLVAAMRCLVTCKTGPTLEMPVTLLEKHRKARSRQP